MNALYRGVRRESILKQFARHYQLVLLLLPALIYLAVFNYWPIYGVQIAFRAYQPNLGFWGSEWLGLYHFQRFLQYPDFLHLIQNTISITLYRLAAGFPIPIFIAVMINEEQNKPFKKTVQMLTYLPHFISTVVVCGMITLFLNRDAGLFNIVGRLFGRPAVAYLTLPSAYPHIHVWSGIWQNSGWATIIYLAALSQVDTQVTEAAVVDGASRAKRIWHVDLPCIAPTIIIQFLLSVGSLFSVGFEKILLLQNDLNRETADVISTYVYRVGLINGQFSYTTAIDLFNTLINLALLFLFNAAARKLTETSMF